VHSGKDLGDGRVMARGKGADECDRTSSDEGYCGCDDKGDSSHDVADNSADCDLHVTSSDHDDKSSNDCN
jgi:hypothetical protein